MKIPIQKIAELANISLTPEEEKHLSKDLEGILRHVEEMNAIEKLSEVPPTSHPHNTEDVFREDIVKDQGAARDVLKHAPDSFGNFFKVPKVIDNA